MSPAARQIHTSDSGLPEVIVCYQVQRPHNSSLWYVISYNTTTLLVKCATLYRNYVWPFHLHQGLRENARIWTVCTLTGMLYLSPQTFSPRWWNLRSRTIAKLKV